MKNYTLIVVVILAFTTFYSCDSEADNPTATEDVSSKEVAEQEDVLTLDNGQKWKVPEAMMWNIQQQKDKVFEYTMFEDVTYEKLGFELDSLCKDLVQNCTMTGVAHNNLHIWLIPYWETIDAINASDDHLEALDHIFELQDAYVEFNEYFE